MKKTKNRFNPKSKSIGNVDRMINFFNKGNNHYILFKIDSSNAFNHA